MELTLIADERLGGCWLSAGGPAPRAPYNFGEWLLVPQDDAAAGLDHSVHFGSIEADAD
jgi:hypothetical protein